MSFINLRSLEAYMIVNFKAHGISRGVSKLAQIFTLIIKKKKKDKTQLFEN